MQLLLFANAMGRRTAHSSLGKVLGKPDTIAAYSNVGSTSWPTQSRSPEGQSYPDLLRTRIIGEATHLIGPTQRAEHAEAAVPTITEADHAPMMSSGYR